jgi:Xaa-Pro dipeptidase
LQTAPIVNEELVRAQNSVAAMGCDFMLLSSIHNVTYVSGFEVPIPVGAGAETAYGPTLALCPTRGDGSWLIASSANAANAKAQSRLDQTCVFGTFDSFEPLDSQVSFLETTLTVLKTAGLDHTPATLGIESRTTPYAVIELLARDFPKLHLVNVEAAVARARIIKTPREIGLLRRAAHVGDIGQNALIELTRSAGRNEFEMWAELTEHMFRAVGHDIPVSGELVTGPRTCTVQYPNGPRNRITQAGDAVLMDISQRVDGYWSDVTNTLVVATGPTAHQRKFARASQAAFDAAADNLRVGRRASDAWLAANEAYAKHGMAMPHYMGHQIGVTVNELPRVVPYDDTPIQAGMVFSLEPGAYEGKDGTFGARSEKMVLVTESGPEVISTFEWGIN